MREKLSIKKGVGQDFNVCIQHHWKRSEDIEVKVKIQGETINMVRFAHDITIVAENKQDLKSIIGEIEELMGT